MKIHRLALRNYRGVDEVTVEFAETGVTVVEGDNEVGKTSLGEAIKLILEYVTWTRFCIYAILRLDGHHRGDRNVETKKKRLTLDLDPPLQRRLKAVAALKGISMRQYCQTAIEKELTRDEAQGVTALPFGHEGLDRLAALQAEVSQGRTLPGDSADLIREARESRAAS